MQIESNRPHPLPSPPAKSSHIHSPRSRIRKAKTSKTADGAHPPPQLRLSRTASRTVSPRIAAPPLSIVPGRWPSSPTPDTLVKREEDPQRRPSQRPAPTLQSGERRCARICLSDTGYALDEGGAATRGSRGSGVRPTAPHLPLPCTSRPVL